MTKHSQTQTNLILDFSWSSFNTSIMACTFSCPIEHFNYSRDGKARLHLKKSDAEKISEFLLTTADIKTRTDNTIMESSIFLYFQLDAEIFVTPNHHIEMRVR